MLEEKGKVTRRICMYIIILVISMIIIKFFTKDSVTTKETIVGVNPIILTKSSLVYQEPLNVVLEQKVKEAVVLQIPKMQENITIKEESNTEIKIEQPVIENDINKEVEVSEIKKVEELQNSIPTEYKGYATIGKIEIPKTGVNIPILNQVTVNGMENAPCLLYSTGELNENGNNLIVGHNYRNGTLFSNNKNLKIGDKINITTLEGKRVEYTIYNKFVTTAEDVSYIKRDTNNKPEITLSCCTDDDQNRIIILAKM